MTKPKRPSSYSDYSLEDLQTICGIANRKEALNLSGEMIEPSVWLKQSLEYGKVLPLNTEKAKSEWLITPLLTELANRNRHKFNLFSGNTFDVDVTKSLKGRCDFLLTKNLSLNISAPVIAIFEAKDDNLDHWYGQCGAEMVGARLFNQMKNEPIEIIHGAVTNGESWQFLRLTDSTLLIDTETYGLANLTLLLGTLQKVVDFYY